MKMIKAELIIFDLDGTLIDSKKDIAVALNETFEAMSLPLLTDEDIYAVVGNGVRPLLDKAMSESDRMDEMDVAVGHFRKFYPKRLLDTTVMFDGVLEVLDHFKSTGKQMAVASNKPYGYVKAIVDGLDMSRFFISVKGGDSFKSKKPEPEMLNFIIDKAGVSKEETLFVGDSMVDIMAGKNAKVKTIGVTYGFRPREEIVDSEPDLMVENPLELKKVIK